MKTLKQVLRPERVRTVPEQFSWVDHSLVQHHLIDRCSNRSAALYLFLVTVADCAGLSYYGTTTLASRLHISEAELAAARTELITLDLIAWQAPLYQVLALPSTRALGSPATRTAPTHQAARPASQQPRPTRSPYPTQLPESARPTPSSNVRTNTGPVSLAQLLDLERRHAQL
jgi:hypothetical protein